MIQLLKLGGSLITDKANAKTPRRETLSRIALEIAAYRRCAGADGRLILGHGSGSFGHIPAKKYQTRSGVRSAEAWRGFAEVHSEVTALNRLVLDALREAGLPVLSFTAMDGIRCVGGRIAEWDLTPLIRALDNGLIPLVFGDTAFDSVRGGTIVSTEELFGAILERLPEPSRVLLAGIEDGIYSDFPIREKPIRAVSLPLNQDYKLQYVKESIYPDVTGGMKSKIDAVAGFLRDGTAKEALIFSGDKPGAIERALSGERIGTVITAARD